MPGRGVAPIRSLVRTHKSGAGRVTSSRHLPRAAAGVQGALAGPDETVKTVIHLIADASGGAYNSQD
jgi:hypothetical protein